MDEILGFLKEAGGVWRVVKGVSSASTKTVSPPTARISMPKSGPKIVKATSPSKWRRTAAAGALGLGAGAVGGGMAVSGMNKQEPLQPGTLAVEKRRSLMDRFGNY